MTRTRFILAAILCLGAALVPSRLLAQSTAVLGVSVNPTNATLVRPVEFFSANSNRLQEALGITNIPAGLRSRSYQVETIAVLTNLNWQTTPALATNGAAIALWRAARGDRGGGLLVLHPTSTATVDNGLVFPATPLGRWIRWRPDGSRAVSMDWWGATGDGVTDDSSAFISAASAIQAQGGGDFIASGPIHLVHDPGTGLASWSNLANVRLVTDSATFVTDDFADSTFTSIVLTNSGTTATATWSSPHGMAAGRVFCIKGSTDAAFNGVWTVAASNSPTDLTFSLTTYNVPAGPATAIARVSDIGRSLFRFDACTNVDVGNLVFRGVEHPRDIQYRIGYRAVEVRKRSTKIRGELSVRGTAYGWYTGEWGIQSLGDCTDFDVGVWAASVGYPVACSGSGHDSIFRIHGENLHRGGYFGGVKRSKATAWIKNWDVAGCILNHQPNGPDQFGCEDFQLRVHDTGTTEPIALLSVGGTRYLATVSGYDSTNEVRHRNLDVQVFGRNLIQTSGLLVQTLSSNHWIDGLTFGGCLDQSGIAFTNLRSPLFVYSTSPAATAGQFRDIVFKDWRFFAPADANGSISSWVVLANPHNDVVFDGYESHGLDTVIGLPPGVHGATVPRFPGWSHRSFEAALGQRMDAGIRLEASKIVVPMVGRLGSNDFTLQWVGTVPSGNAGLFTITAGTNATSGAFGASITNGDLIARAFGPSATDWSGVIATNWATGLRGKVACLVIVKTDSGLALYTDGHSTAGLTAASGTPPAWSDSLSGTNAHVGAEVSSPDYWGTVYRFAVWNYDKGSELPSLAVRWGAGSDSVGADRYTIDQSTGNGGFETLGMGTNVFSGWTQMTEGSSSISVSTNAIQGTNSIAISVDGAASFAGVTSDVPMIDGERYVIDFWARVVGGTSGAIALVGAAGGDYPISISGSWVRRSVSLQWNSPTFTIKRYSLTGQTAEIDGLTIRQVGSLADCDWTTSPADRGTGAWPSFVGSGVRVISRGMGLGGDRGDTSITLRPGLDAPVQWFGSPLSGDRTVALSPTAARIGDQFRIIRTGAGLGSLSVSGTPISSNQWVEVMFMGTGWTNVAMGSTRLP